MKRTYTIKIGDQLITYSFVYSQTVRYFQHYICQIKKDTCDITMNNEYLEKYKWLSGEDDKGPYHEFRCCMLATGDYLLQYDSALFHGAAFIWKGKAWILTAPSGTGKTTQLKHWLNLFKEQVSVLNGDKPVLQCEPDGSVYVCSSPWMGKESLGSPDLKAPLGGIIILEQGKENHIRKLNTKDAVLSLFVEFISSSGNVSQLLSQASILNRVLDSAPVWKLINKGDEESARLTYLELSKYMESKRYEIQNS